MIQDPHDELDRDTTDLRTLSAAVDRLEQEKAELVEALRTLLRETRFWQVSFAIQDAALAALAKVGAL